MREGNLKDTVNHCSGCVHKKAALIRRIVKLPVNNFATESFIHQHALGQMP